MAGTATVPTPARPKPVTLAPGEGTIRTPIGHISAHLQGKLSLYSKKTNGLSRQGCRNPREAAAGREVGGRPSPACSKARPATGLHCTAEGPQRWARLRLDMRTALGIQVPRVLTGTSPQRPESRGRGGLGAMGSNGSMGSMGSTGRGRQEAVQG